MSLKDMIISRCKDEGLLRNECAYVLATAEWESNFTFEPVKEAYWVKNAEAWRKKNLRYWPWYGRGLVQLTWEANYRKAGKAIGVDLIADPDAAMEPENSVAILVLGMKHGWFTGKRLSDYFDLKRSEFIGARRMINGTDKAAEIAALARKHDAELKAAGYGVDVPKPVTPPAPETPASEPLKPGNWVSALVAFVAAIIAAFRRKK